MTAARLHARTFVPALAVGLGVGLTLSMIGTAGCDRGTSTDVAKVGAAIADACTAITADCLPKLSYVDTTGTRHTPESLTNKVVIVNLWATWCGPCKRELPEFSKVADAYKDKDVLILGLLTDDPEPQVLLDFMTDYGISYPIVTPDSTTLARFDFPKAVSGIPTTFAYDRKGNRRKINVGPMTANELRGVIDSLLAEKAL